MSPEVRPATARQRLTRGLADASVSPSRQQDNINIAPGPGDEPREPIAVGNAWEPGHSDGGVLALHKGPQKKLGEMSSRCTWPSSAGAFSRGAERGPASRYILKRNLHARSRRRHERCSESARPPRRNEISVFQSDLPTISRLSRLSSFLSSISCNNLIRYKAA